MNNDAIQKALKRARTGSRNSLLWSKAKRHDSYVSQDSEGSSRSTSFLDPDSQPDKQVTSSRVSVVSTDYRTSVTLSTRTSVTMEKRNSASESGDELYIRPKSKRMSQIHGEGLTDDHFSDVEVIFENGVSEESETSSASEQEPNIQLTQEINEESKDQNKKGKRRKKRKRKNKRTDDTKFKTEMCKNWSETGRCNYGKKCQFAHGQMELHERTQADEKYRSKLCKSFTTNDSCMYGQRCQFQHDSRTLQEIRTNYSYQKIINNPPDLTITIPIKEDNTYKFYEQKVLTLTTQYVERCRSLKQIVREASPPPPLRSNSLDKYLIQHWMRSSEFGLILHPHATSSEDGSLKETKEAVGQETTLNIEFIYDLE